jgi:hypothetical protein
MKDATLNIKLSQQLYDRVKAEAEKYGVSMAAFVRATLARQIFGEQKEKLLGEDYTIIDRDGSYIFALGQVKNKKEE